MQYYFSSQLVLRILKNTSTKNCLNVKRAIDNRTLSRHHQFHLQQGLNIKSIRKEKRS
uniref:Uncharacterized protein n=1 Tax=Rhizophora mucronata TaxID=61149 RepID=A0A2P2LBI3_RHIMU